MQNYWFVSPIGDLLALGHMEAYFLRAAFSEQMSIRRAPPLGEVGARKRPQVVARLQSHWERNPFLQTAEQTRKWAAISGALTAELFSALTVLCVHCGRWTDVLSDSTKVFCLKWRSIFCCCPLFAMKMLWIHTATHVQI